ncbi:MAG: hypothetical protein ACK4GN_16860 [Runella sp.]
MKSLLSFLMLVSSVLLAQTPPPKLFLNCQNTRCYDDYIRTELTFFEFVRDRIQSDIEVLVVSQPTGGGGRSYTLTFLGHHQYTFIADTIAFNTRQTDTEDMVRKALLKVIKQGLVRYLIDTDLMAQINVSFPKRKLEDAKPTRDPWNYWVFNIGGNGMVRGESNKTNTSLSSNFRVSRVSPSSKFIFSGYHTENRNRFNVNGQDVKVVNVNYGFSSLYVKGFSEHWSAGGFYRGFHSIYQNIQFSHSVAPALEYSVFPISQITRRQFRWVYQAGLRDLNYIETTIFDKLQEMLPYHQVTGIFGVTEPWGNFSAELTAYQYLHDTTKNRFSFDLDFSWRVIEGLFLRFTGGASIINNQISLAKATGSSEEILLSTRQLPTTFRYNSSLGLNFTFGSINNNVVNPRFAGVD